MDIVAVLTKVVQEQKLTLNEKSQVIERQQETLENLAAAVTELKAEIKRLKGKNMTAGVTGQE
jgi:cell division protein FtsB